MQSPVELLRKLDIATLERLAGETIVRAVRSAYNTNLESALAQLVSDRYGDALLAERAVRLAIIDTLPETVARAFCLALGKSISSTAIAHVELQRHFSSAFGETKSKQFVEFLALPDSLILRKVPDVRDPAFEVNCHYGEEVRLRNFLHPYQKRVKDHFIKQMEVEGRRLMVQMPTGSGKTYTALEGVVDVFRLPFQDEFVVWIVDSNELAEQALESFQYLWKVKGDRPLTVCRLFAQFEPDFPALQGGMVFASFDKVRAILTDPEHPAYTRLWHLLRKTAMLVVDEAHTSVAETYETIIRAFVDREGTKLIGLSATPGRNDPELGQELARLYTGNLLSITDHDGKVVTDAIDYLQEGGYLARIQVEELESNVQLGESDEDRVCKALAENSTRNKTILDQIARANESDESTIVFACTKDHVLALVALCRAKGIPAEFIIGETPQVSRVDILHRFRERTFRILINYEILSTGVDLPNVSRMIITRPVRSAILYSQILGRALRGPKNGGNEQNTVVNIRDNLFNFPTANFVYASFRSGFTTH